MVTSNEFPDKKVVKMSEQNMGIVVPQRTLLGEVNEHIMCPLCRGYYIDATTIVECLHSFCRSCIIKHLQVKSYCPVCEMMINSAKPNIKLDKALQDIVYKLVPGLFQKEMERRQQFYASRPGPAASATPEQRGEDTERVIFSPEDVISFSLEYADATDTDSISSKSSAELDSNEPQPPSAIARRYLQCPAVVNISHLKKFLSMKFDIDSTQFAIDILYKRVPLPDYYTLMDIAYIYNWKRNEPMRFFYQIIDYVAIRNRLFDINRNGPKYRERKSSPASTEETNASSPAANLNDNGSEASSGTDSPMPTENLKETNETCQNKNNSEEVVGANTNSDNSNNSEDVEKSQFLNSFELTAKSNSVPTVKISPIKSNTTETTPPDSEAKSQPTLKIEDNLKRKQPTTANVPEIKKLKIELEKTKIPGHPSTSLIAPKEKPEEYVKIKGENIATVKQQCPESPAVKLTPTLIQRIPYKRKVSSESTNLQPTPTLPKTVSPLKLQIPKLEPPSPMLKQPDMQKSVPKKIPDLKPSVPNPPQSNQSKSQLSTKVRMDLLANNSDPTIDRSKIMSQVKSSLNLQSMGQASGDLKSLFNSCKINIPSSLSITLTDQKDQRNPNDTPNADSKSNVINKNLAGPSNVVPHGIPTTPVHNYIEILKLPDSEPKKQIKSDNNSESKSTPTAKAETGSMQQKPPGKSSETSAKGPVPNLKPIDPKAGKQNVNFTAPITFQQSFEQQVHSLQTDKKPKPKNKSQVPKLVLANPKTFSAVNKLSGGNIKPSQGGLASNTDNKPSTALDLSTPHNIQSHLSPHQTKTLETMQSIANLANKQNLPSKNTSLAMPPIFNTVANRPIATGSLRVPSTSLVSPHKLEQVNTSATHSSLRPDASKNQSNKLVSNPIPITTSPNYQLSLQPSTPTHPSPRSQTRSPSSSPKLVIAEEKQIPSTSNIPESNLNQSSQISSTHGVTNPKNESTKVMPGLSKPGLKPIKPVPSANKISGVRQPMPSSSVKSNPAQSNLNILSHELLRHSMGQMGQMDMSAWLSAHSTFNMYKSMTNRPQHFPNDFNKDKP